MQQSALEAVDQRVQDQPQLDHHANEPADLNVPLG